MTADCFFLLLLFNADEVFKAGLIALQVLFCDYSPLPTWSLWLSKVERHVNFDSQKNVCVYLCVCVCVGRVGGLHSALCCVGGVWSQCARAWRSELVGRSSVLRWAVCPLCWKWLRRQTRYSNLTHVYGRLPPSLLQELCHHHATQHRSQHLKK